MMVAEQVKTYAFVLSDDGEIIGEIGSEKVQADAGVEVDQKVKAYMAAHGTVDYGRVLRIILDKYPALRQAYLGVRDKPSDDEHKGDAGARIHQLVQERMGRSDGLSYGAAYHQVLAENPKLKSAYAGSGGQ